MNWVLHLPVNLRNYESKRKILIIDKNFFLDYIFRQGGKKISLMDDLFYCGLLTKYN